MKAKLSDVKQWIHESRSIVIELQTTATDPQIRKILSAMAALTNAVDALAETKK